MSSQYEYEIKFLKKDWERYSTETQYISTRRNSSNSSRKTFLASFSHILSEKLQILGNLKKNYMR
jgi:hypothetical protein